MNNLYKKLLKEYSDSLIKNQITESNPSFKGGFLCPSCKNIHGRSIDAIYGLAVAYKVFKDTKYLNALTILFDYSANLLCTDGGLYNDLQTEWRFTTTFHEIALVETLVSCKDILPNDLVRKIEERIAIHGKWLYENLNQFSKANINYCTTNALALLLAGKYLQNDAYIKQAYCLVNYALEHISKNNLFYGEVQPHSFKTEKGCLGIDIGYNLEESLPALAKFAYVSKDNEILEKVYRLGLGHLPFILPDGAIDNSFGDRNYKWTYYGSRTCDGIIPLCLILGNKDKRFIEAANRNLALIDRCSPTGYLFGGPDYYKHHEEPCLHHTFEHINAIAFAIDNFEDSFTSISKIDLPTDGEFVTYIEEMNSYRISNKNYILDVSDNDINIPYSGHLTGGTITLLFSKKENKPIIVGSVGDYKLTESTNMQVPLNRDQHKPGYPRIDSVIKNEHYTTGYFKNANVEFDKENKFHFFTRLTTRDGKEIVSDNYEITYLLTNDGLKIKVKSDVPFVYKLPLTNGNIDVNKGIIKEVEETFFLTPGFIHKEHQIQSVDNYIEIEVK